MSTAQPPEAPSLDRPFLAEVFGLARDGLARAGDEGATGANRLRLLSILERAPCLIAVTRGPEHILEFANPACLRVLDAPDLAGRPLGAMASALGGDSFLEGLDHVYRTGTSQTRETTALQARPTTDAGYVQYMDIVLQPLLDAERSVAGVLIEGHDVTARVLADQRQALMLDELKHRVQNTLATVTALTRIGRESATSLDGFTESLTRRIMAMSRAQDLIAVAVSGIVPVLDVLNVELSPYLCVGGPVELACEDLRVTTHAAVNLSLIVHELLTNTAKYGALASPGGLLKIACVRRPDGGELSWREYADRPMGPAGPPGFGTRLIETLARGRGGGARIERRPDGLDVTVRFAAIPDGATA